MLNAARQYMLLDAWIAILPGLAIALTGRLPADALSPELEAELCRAFAGLSRS